jgi:hypothetical protein
VLTIDIFIEHLFNEKDPRALDVSQTKFLRVPVLDVCEYDPGPLDLVLEENDGVRVVGPSVLRGFDPLQSSQVPEYVVIVTPNGVHGRVNIILTGSDELGNKVKVCFGCEREFAIWREEVIVQMFVNWLPTL